MTQSTKACVVYYSATMPHYLSEDGAVTNHRENIQVVGISPSDTKDVKGYTLYSHIDVPGYVMEDLCRPGTVLFCSSIKECNRVEKYVSDFSSTPCVIVNSEHPLTENDAVRSDCIWIATDSIASGVTLPHAVRGCCDGRTWKPRYYGEFGHVKLTNIPIDKATEVQMAGRLARQPRQNGLWYQFQRVSESDGDNLHTQLKAKTLLTARSISTESELLVLANDLMNHPQYTPELCRAAEKLDMDAVSFRTYCNYEEAIPHHFAVNIKGYARQNHD